MIALLLLAALLGPDDPVLQRHAPLLERRANAVGTQSDIPLLLYVEQLADDRGAKYLQYTVIFSNEDGGTSTRALMARWGRTTDIEHVYRVWVGPRGERVKATIQTKDHQDIPYTGPFVGDRPLLAVITDNNMVGPGVGTGERADLKPVLVDLRNASREQVMDERPEMYRISAEELEREGKLGLIGDPRNYLYLEFEVVNTGGSRVAAFVELGNGKQYRSDAGNEKWSIERSGFARTTIELPPGTAHSQIRTFGFACLAVGVCEVRQVTKAFFLDRDYRPGKSLLERRLDSRIKAKENRAWSWTSR